MHSVKYAYIEVYLSINNENILELSKQMTTKSLGGFWPVSMLTCISPVPYGKFNMLQTR